MNNKEKANDMDNKEVDRDDLIDKTVSNIVDLLQDYTTHDIKYLKYMMILVNNPTISVEPETDWDIKIDATVKTINTLLEPLTVRQRMYAIALLNSTMNHFFEKLGMQDEIQSLVFSIVESISKDIVGEKRDQREGIGHD